ncbi:MAG: UDP-N-acetylglucosamine 2-epimerase [Burkholderiaceae bacterium]|nr:UDP-N-acetylglucosamine 2-epimerase [Burkholderiaceae bacterium]
MYESYFGLTGSPFQLNPDPAFYFDSRGHSNALSYLKFGVHQGEGFIVVTGEIGAGKTTLVRTLLGELNTDEVVAGQVLNTQLESGELLQSILTAFGVAAQGTSKAQLLASLEAFLTDVAAQGRRALLIVDEAQNLGREAIEEIRMLSNFQLGNHALLQSFLVGQPELRKQLESPAMEQLRQRVIASCHLGPLTAEETQAYVEHRMRHVGWDGERPAFLDGAFTQVYKWTGGIPRKINLLCNRLLLAAFLGEQNDISAAMVEETGKDLARETGGVRAVSALAAPANVPTLMPDDADQPATSGRVSVPTAAQDVVRILRAETDFGNLIRPLVCVADTPLAYLKFAALAAAMRQDETLPPIVLVNPGVAPAIEADGMPEEYSGALAAEVHLGVTYGPVADRIALAVLRFGELLDQLAPVAVVSTGDSDAVMSCVYLASKRGLPLARLGAGQRREMQDHGCDLNAVMLDRMSEVLYTPMLKTHYTLYREGIASDRMVCVGSLVAEALHRALGKQPPVSELLKAMGISRDLMRRAMRGFVFVSAQVGEGDLEPAEVSKVARVARDLGKETLVIWMVTEATREAIASGKADQLLQRSGVVLAPYTGYIDELGLVRGATCVIAGPGWNLVEEADSLDIPSIVMYPDGEVPAGAPGGVIAKIPCDSVACVRALHEILERGRADDEVVDATEGAAATRLIEHLRRWLPMPTPRPLAKSSNTGTSSGSSTGVSNA